MHYLSTIHAQLQPLYLSVKGTDTPMRGARFPEGACLSRRGAGPTFGAWIVKGKR